MKINIRPLTALAFVLSSLGVVEIGRIALNATGAFAATEAPATSEPNIAPSGEAEKTDIPVSAPPPTCLPVDLAKEAGISAAEFRLLQALQERRQQLDARERDIITREGIIKTADDVVRARIASLQAVEANIQKLLGQVDEVEAARIGALVRVYEKMKPKDAAAVMEGLSDEVVIAIASRMKDGPLALILGKMNPVRARQITTQLAQIDEGKALMQSAEQAPASTPAAAPKTPPKNQMANNQPKSNQPASPTGAGPNSPNQPSAPAPKAPNAPSPTSAAPKAATGQAPADPSPKAANGAAAKQ